jgi:hypothetical protein
MVLTQDVVETLLGMASDYEARAERLEKDARAD